MEPKKTLLLVARVIALSVINFIIWFIASSVVTTTLGIPVHSDIQAAPLTIMLLMLATSFCNTLVLSWAIVRSGFNRWKLVFIVFLIYFGISTFLSQIETIYFNVSLNIPTIEITSFFINGFITAIVFSLLSVLILGKFKKLEGSEFTPQRLTQSKGVLYTRIAIISVIIYPVLYFGFGYFVLWQFSAARAFYSGTTEKLSFFSHMWSLRKGDPWIYPWQVLRGLIWVGVALPVIRMNTAKKAETAVLVGFLFAVIMNVQHIIPNPYMPRIISMAHFLETATSNFILGFVITLFLLKNKRH